MGKLRSHSKRRQFALVVLLGAVLVSCSLFINPLTWNTSRTITRIPITITYGGGIHFLFTLKHLDKNN